MTGLLALALAALLGIGAAGADTSTPAARNNSTQSVEEGEVPPPDDPDARAYIIDLG